MTKTILLTGATDGIGLETAKQLVALGHTVLVHGRSASKLADTMQALAAVGGSGQASAYRADLSDLSAVNALADAIAADHTRIDVIINNAGVFKTPKPQLDNGFDVRFVVNTLAPWLLTQRLLPLLPAVGRVVNLSSAAQAPVDLNALAGKRTLDDSSAYAQSKLAITMWSRHLAKQLATGQPVIVAVNPASFIGSKMVKDAYGMDGKDLSVGANILVDAALGDKFADASGKYFDNDSGRFASPHPDALDDKKNAALVDAVESLIAQLTA
ncbi:MAG: SDR family NAD(P)-dependent oxidoreductase [Pseudomonadota bacterium]